MDPATIFSIVAACIKGLQQVHQYCSEFQAAELKVKELVSECKAFNTAIAAIRDSVLYVGDREISDTLNDFHEHFSILYHQLRQVVQLADSSGGAAPDKTMAIRARISATWNAKDIEAFRTSITRKATLLNLLIQTHNSRKQGVIEAAKSAELHRLRRQAASDTESLRTTVYSREHRDYQDELLESGPYQKLRQKPASSSSEMPTVYERIATAPVMTSTTKAAVTARQVRTAREKLISWLELNQEILSLRNGTGDVASALRQKMKQGDDMLQEVTDEVMSWEDLVGGSMGGSTWKSGSTWMVGSFSEEERLVARLLVELKELRETRMNFAAK
ncbi:hypothetical protein QBC43DRAFT_123477 [Cladorrhinum sp. PSN259]|nr:hypothetical protein QBC43DRAFT_123477 [Cladorrhinum sp. PSN259]